MGRRTIAILIFIVGLLALSAVGIIFLRQQSQTPTTVTTGEETTPGVETGEPGVSEPGLERATASAPTNQVVVSLQTVPRGWQLTEAELTYDDRLATEIDSNVITNMEDAVGLYARTDIFQGQTLTKDVLVNDPRLAGEDYGPSSLIPPGFVAVAIPMDRLSSVAYALSAGDSIDIMLSFVFYKVDPQFQTLLQNSATFPIEVVQEGNEGETITTTTFLVVDPLGRFEELPTGDLAHITPNGDGRPVPVSMILQNAKVIQVGEWEPVPPVQAATPTPEPVQDPNASPTPDTGVPVVQVTPTLPTPSVLLVALSPQQQLFLKYAIESNANIDYALRGVGDGQLYSVENISLDYLLQRFNIEVPLAIEYTLGGISVTVTPPPSESVPEEAPPPEDG